MTLLENLILVGGVLHFGLLIGGALLPFALDWQRDLAKLSLFTRQVVWVHGSFIVLLIIGLGLLSVVFAPDLASGTPLARSICGFIALFWLARLSLQFFLFDPRPYFTRWYLALGDRGLTCVFAYHAAVYGWAAFVPVHGA